MLGTAHLCSHGVVWAQLVVFCCMWCSLGSPSRLHSAGVLTEVPQCSSTWLLSVPACEHSPFGYLGQTSFQHGEWFPREQKEKLPGLLRAKPGTGLLSLLPHSTVKVSHKTSPGSRRREVASNSCWEKQHCVQGWCVGSHSCTLITTLPKIVHAHHKPNNTEVCKEKSSLSKILVTFTIFTSQGK